MEGSINQCYTSLVDLSEDGDTVIGRSGGNKSKFQKDDKIRAIVQELEQKKARSGCFPPHPKMDKLKLLLVEHFAQKKFDREDAKTGGAAEVPSGDSRVMVFVSYRQCVDEIVDMLDHEKPLIRAVQFIGQDRKSVV